MTGRHDLVGGAEVLGQHLVGRHGRALAVAAPGPALAGEPWASPPPPRGWRRRGRAQAAGHGLAARLPHQVAVDRPAGRRGRLGPAGRVHAPTLEQLGHVDRHARHRQAGQGVSSARTPSSPGRSVATARCGRSPRMRSTQPVRRGPGPPRRTPGRPASYMARTSSVKRTPLATWAASRLPDLAGVGRVGVGREVATHRAGAGSITSTASRWRRGCRRRPPPPGCGRRRPPGRRLAVIPASFEPAERPRQRRRGPGDDQPARVVVVGHHHVDAHQHLVAARRWRGHRHHAAGVAVRAAVDHGLGPGPRSGRAGSPGRRAPATHRATSSP